jgi:hypothetical protein
LDSLFEESEDFEPLEPESPLDSEEPSLEAAAAAPFYFLP